MYNRFHDSVERDPEIPRMLALHAAMNRAVLIVYGLRHFSSDCLFLLDYQINEVRWYAGTIQWLCLQPANSVGETDKRSSMEVMDGRMGSGIRR